MVVGADDKGHVFEIWSQRQDWPYDGETFFIRRVVIPLEPVH